MNDMQILGLFLILIVYVGFLIYCDYDINHRSRSKSRRTLKNRSHKSDSMSAAEISVAASYISDSSSDSGGYSGGGSGGGD